MTETVAVRSYQTFVVPRVVGGHGDLLAAVGLADLLAETVGASKVSLSAAESAIGVRLGSPLDDTALDALTVSPGYRYLRPKVTANVPEGITDVVDYEREKERDARHREAQKALSKAGSTDPDLRRMVEEDRPLADWRLWQVINMMSAHQSANDFQATIARARPETRRSMAAAGLRAIADSRRSGLGWKTGSVQLFNPTAAKGYARLKPDGTGRNDKTKDAWADPFVEWLRCRGYFRAACPFFAGDGIRLFVPVPVDLSLAALATIADAMRQAPLWGTGVKIDALAVIWLADHLVHYSRELQSSPPDADDEFGISFGGLTPADVVSGLAITHYQKLGSARIVAEMTTIALPGWFPIRDRSDAETWIEILDEHRRVVRGLNDEHSDEITLLVSYRRFLNRRGDSALWAFLDFASAYGPFLMRARETGRRIRGFRTGAFRRLVESMADTEPVAPILADPGFQAVAAAVRRATVSAQALNANNREHREIRYDLLPELRRAWTAPEDGRFIEVVAEFVAKYNYENARRRETGKGRTPNIATEEFAAFTDLVDRRGPRLVGALLSAYGTCTTRYDAAAAGEPDDTEPETLDAGPTDDAAEEGED